MLLIIAIKINPTCEQHEHIMAIDHSHGVEVGQYIGAGNTTLISDHDNGYGKMIKIIIRITST